MAIVGRAGSAGRLAGGLGRRVWCEKHSSRRFRWTLRPCRDGGVGGARPSVAEVGWLVGVRVAWGWL